MNEYRVYSPDMGETLETAIAVQSYSAKIAAENYLGRLVKENNELNKITIVYHDQLRVYVRDSLGKDYCFISESALQLTFFARRADSQSAA